MEAENDGRMGEAVTWRENPIIISLSLLVGATVFIAAFVAATIQGEAKW
jgi:hypothetical protein